jgi:hypothetical protein
MSYTHEQFLAGRGPVLPVYLRDGRDIPTERAALRRHLDSIQTQERDFENALEWTLNVAQPLKEKMRPSWWQSLYGDDMAWYLQVISALQHRRVACQARLLNLR